MGRGTYPKEENRGRDCVLGWMGGGGGGRCRGRTLEGGYECPLTEAMGQGFGLRSRKVWHCWEGEWPGHEPGGGRCKTTTTTTTTDQST